MIGALPGVAVLVAVGLLPAWSLVRRPAEAVVASPLAGALVLVPGGVVAVATATSPVPWAVAGVAAANLWAWRSRRREPAWHPAAGLAHLGVVVAAFGAVAAAFLARQPVDWDAHSIWLYHSDWFAVGGRAAREAFRLDDFSHPDYPPLLPAAAGTVSRLVHGRLEWRTAQMIIAAVSWSALATAGAVLIDAARRRWVATAGVLALGAAAVAALGFGVANAEADFAAAAAVVLAAAALLLRLDPGLVPLGLVAATAGALCKGESLLAALVVVAIAWLDRGRPRQVRWAVPALAGLGWTVLARALGAGSTVTRDGGGLSPARVVDRGWPSLQRLIEEMRPIVVFAALASIGCAVLVRATRRRLLLLWVAVALQVAALTLLYAIGGFELRYWLETSAARVATGPELLAAVSAVLAVEAGVDLLVSGQRRTAPPAVPAPAS